MATLELLYKNMQLKAIFFYINLGSVTGHNIKDKVNTVKYESFKNTDNGYYYIPKVIK